MRRPEPRMKSPERSKPVRWLDSGFDYGDVGGDGESGAYRLRWRLSYLSSLEGRQGLVGCLRRSDSRRPTWVERVERSRAR